MAALKEVQGEEADEDPMLEMGLGGGGAKVGEEGAVERREWEIEREQPLAREKERAKVLDAARVSRVRANKGERQWGSCTGILECRVTEGQDRESKGPAGAMCHA